MQGFMHNQVKILHYMNFFQAESNYLEIMKWKSKKLILMKVIKKELLERVDELHEFNPMLGLRGCRLGITMPEITRMQSQH